jgi:hypothetical protein
MYHTVVEANTKAATESTINEFMERERERECVCVPLINPTIRQ